MIFFVAKTFFKGAFSREPSLSKLFDCYQIFVDEIEGADGVYWLAEVGEMGEFSNEKGRYNDTFYVRYQLEEDGEYFNERVLGF